MRGQFSPQKNSTGAGSKPKMPGKAHRMAIYENGEVLKSDYSIFELVNMRFWLKEQLCEQ